MQKECKRCKCSPHRLTFSAFHWCPTIKVMTHQNAVTPRSMDLPQDLRAISLHNSAQAAITQGVRTALATEKQKPYLVSRKCGDCRRLVERWDATDALIEVRTESPEAAGMRAGIVLAR